MEHKDQETLDLLDLRTRERDAALARVAELEKTCGEWWAACSGIPAASPHTLRTALKEAGERILGLRDRVAELDDQIDRLASYICGHVPGEPSQNEGAVDTAIRVMSRVAELEAAEKQRKDTAAKCWGLQAPKDGDITAKYAEPPAIDEPKTNGGIERCDCGRAASHSGDCMDGLFFPC